MAKNKYSFKRKYGNSEDLLDELIRDYSQTKYYMLVRIKQKKISKEEFAKDALRHIDDYYDVPDSIRGETISKLIDYIYGYHRLTPLIDDPDISDIHCISYNNIRIKRKGERMDSDIIFHNKQEYARFIEYIATKNQVNISSLNAIQRFTDDDSHAEYILRFTVSMPLVNTYDEPYLCIRKVPKNFPLMEDLIEAEMLDQKMAKVLIERFSAGSTLICGSNSSGKTTILNALKETIPHNMSVLVAQQADELSTKSHPDMIFLHSLPGSNESQAQYDLKNISIAGLTMDIDFFMIGEIKGDEAIYLLNAAYTGQICAATVHAPSADKGIDKLIDYALAGGQYTKSELVKMMDCFKTVIFMKNYKVDQIYAVKGYNKQTEALDYKPIWENGGFVDGIVSENTGNS